MINVPNQLNHITKVQEDFLDFPQPQLQSQRAIYGMTDDYPRRRQAISQVSARGAAAYHQPLPQWSEVYHNDAGFVDPLSARSSHNHPQNILNKSINDIKSMVHNSLHQAGEFAQDVKTRSLRSGERFAEASIQNPNVIMGVEVAKMVTDKFTRFMNDLNSKMEDLVNRMSRPKWEFKPGYQPYCQRSFDAGNYEYEVMIFRRRLNCLDKLAAKYNMPNVLH